MGHQKHTTHPKALFWLVASIMLLLGVIVPRWSVLLVWALAAEVCATLLDISEWLSDRPHRRQHGQLSLSREDNVSLLEPRDSLQRITWEELREHNTASSAWVAVDNKVYDVTSFIGHHPGGNELLLLAAGRDVTDIFASYHPFTNTPEQVLKKFLIGELVTFEHPRFRKDSGFYRECKKRVKEYFDRTGQNPKQPLSPLRRTSMVYIVAVISFCLTFTARPIALPVRILFAVLYGVSQALPLLLFMHDASHAAIGNSERWWRYCGRLSLDWLSGSSMVAWRHGHVIGHHIYTNVLGSDPDLPVSLEGDSSDPRRLLPQQVWKKLYRYQHIYLPPLYGLLALRSRIQDVSDVFLNGHDGPIQVNPLSMQDILRQVGSKSFWLFTRFVVPCWFFEQPLRHFIPLFLFTEFLASYFLAFNFQVSHISSDLNFFVKPSVDGQSAIIDEEWAKLQVKTSVDYAHGSAWDTFFSGALNYQTTHHLFPSVSQCHYPQIAPIIREVCGKYGITYNVLPSFAAALRAHFNHLKSMGEEGKGASLKLD